jgi:hypothetical protein
LSAAVRRVREVPGAEAAVGRSGITLTAAATSFADTDRARTAPGSSLKNVSISAIGTFCCRASATLTMSWLRAASGSEPSLVPRSVFASLFCVQVEIRAPASWVWV